MPSFNGCKLAMATWHRVQEGLQCIPLGSHCQPLTQGAVCREVLNPKVTRCPGWVSSNYVYNEHVSCFRPSFRNRILSFGLCARQVAMFCLAALWAQGMPAIIGRNICLAPSSSPNRTFHVAAGVQLQKPLVWSPFGPIINDMGTSGDVAGDNGGGSLTVGTHITFGHHTKTDAPGACLHWPAAKTFPPLRLWNYSW